MSAVRLRTGFVFHAALCLPFIISSCLQTTRLKFLMIVAGESGHWLAFGGGLAIEVKGQQAVAVNCHHLKDGSIYLRHDFHIENNCLGIFIHRCRPTSTPLHLTCGSLCCSQSATAPFSRHKRTVQ